ncbi:hypothetical protein O6H91_Y021000 [Diphasiastrum complanatum]|nr:hypothetical protein O6H91_Y021000 [Diphasiastrum complanatum]
MEQRLTSDIVRLCRERHFKLGTQQPPHFNAVACFQARAIMLQFPEKFDSEIADNDYVEMLEMCVHHLTRKNCPAQETIQLQINGHAEVCRESNGLAFEVEQRKQVLEKIMQEIVQIKVLDMRETYTTVLALHSRILDYVIESSRHLEQVLLLDTVSEVEIRVALGSVFPQAGLLYWIDLPEIEKKLQVKELADIIPGIRVHNKLMEKGGSSLQLPFEVFKAEIEPLGKRVMEEMQKVNEKAKFCTQAIKSHIDALGMHHVLIQRLRDELAFNLQAFAILETLQFVLNDKLSLVTDIHDKCSEHLKAVCDMIGSRKCVPNELVHL